MACGTGGGRGAGLTRDGERERCEAEARGGAHARAAASRLSLRAARRAWGRGSSPCVVWLWGDCRDIL